MTSSLTTSHHLLRQAWAAASAGGGGHIVRGAGPGTANGQASAMYKRSKATPMKWTGSGKVMIHL